MKINALILGKSGVGKSSLLNYLWGDGVAKVGTGRPVTPHSEDNTVGLYEYAPFNITEHQLVIFDSWGLEADHADTWISTIIDEIDKREGESDLEKWFHAVIYCFSAAGARIEPFEISEILKPLAEQGQAITFALTKADIASEDEISAIKEAINEAYPNNGGIVEICSEEKKLRNGKTTKTCGKDELFINLKKNLARKLRTKLAIKYVEKCKQACDLWKEDAMSLYDSEADFLQSTGTTLHKISEPIKSNLDTKLMEVNKWMQASLNKVETLEEAFQKITNLPEQSRLRDSEVFSAESIQWTPFDHVTAFAKYLIPAFNVYHAFTATSKYREDLEKKLGETISEVLKMAEKTASTRLLATTVFPHPTGRSTNTRPESTIRMMQAIAGKNPN